MPYRTILLPQAARRILSWQLSDFVFTEVYMRLLQQLPLDPTRLLRRLKQPFDGMVYSFSLIDPENRLREHFFHFHVFHGQDEETLHVPRGAYLRTVGW